MSAFCGISLSIIAGMSRRKEPITLIYAAAFIAFAVWKFSNGGFGPVIASLLVLGAIVATFNPQRRIVLGEMAVFLGILVPFAAMVSVQVLDPEPLLHHAEVVRRNGSAVGYVRAGSYGHTVGGAVGLVMVDGDGEPVTAGWLADAEWTVEVNGAEFPAITSLRPLYDPTNARIRA